MKKILMIATLAGTIEGFLTSHIKQLEDLGYRVDLACNTKGELFTDDLKKNTWHHLEFSRTPFSIDNLKAAYHLRCLLKNENYDIIHLHTPIASFIGRFVAHLAKSKSTIYTAHGFHFYKGAPLINWLIYYPIEWLAMRWTDKIITINQEDFEMAKKMACRRNHIYKINGVGLDIKKYSEGNRYKILNEFNFSKKDFVITIIGELNRNKNQIQLIKAVETLKEDVKLLIVGSGPMNEKLKKYVTLKKLDNRVKFLSFRLDINDIIAASSILASLSYREGLPRNIMEGMAQGKAFVATDIRGNRDIIKDGMNGFLTEPGNYYDTAKQIKKLQNKKLLDTIKLTNLSEVKNYSDEKILENLKRIVAQGGGYINELD